MSEDLVSVIMPTFNSERYVTDSIESILNQTYNNIELLITDDGSEDDTVSIIKSYEQKDSRVKIFLLNGNNGAGSARNNSIKHAQGRYIAFCDSDDVWMPEKLEKQIGFMRENKYCFTFASYYVFDSESRKKGIVIAPPSVSLIDTKRDDKIGFLTAIYDTSFFGKFYMPTLRKRQDWAYVLQILQKCGRAYSLREPLAYYRRAKGSISHNKFSLIKYNAKVYSTVFGYSVLHAYIYLFTMFLPAYAMKVINNRITNMRYKKKLDAGM